MQPISIPSAIDVINAEWQRFERERELWKVEKEALNARIQKLEALLTAGARANQDLQTQIVILKAAIRNGEQISLPDIQVNPQVPSLDDLSAGQEESNTELTEDDNESSDKLASSDELTDSDDLDVSSSLESYDSDKTESTSTSESESDHDSPAARVAAHARAQQFTATIAVAPAGITAAVVPVPGYSEHATEPATQPPPKPQLPAGIQLDVSDLTLETSAPSWRQWTQLRSHLLGVRSLAWATVSGELVCLSGGDDCLVKLWPIPNTEARLSADPSCTLRGAEGPVLSIAGGARSGISCVVAGDASGRVIFYRLPDSPVRPYAGVDRGAAFVAASWKEHKEAVWSVLLHPDQLLVVSGDAAGELLWHALPAKVLAPQGQSTTPLVWRQTGPEATLRCHLPEPVVACRGLDSQHFLAATTSSIYVVGWSSGQARAIVRNAPARITGVVRHPVHPLVITSSADGLVRAYTLPAADSDAPAELLWDSTVHTMACISLDVSGDGMYLATASVDRSLRIWRLAPGVETKLAQGALSCVHELSPHRPSWSENITTVLWAPLSAGRLLASGGVDSAVQLLVG